jgi:phosphatidylglycerol:prolipoprotein diacylglycerol transferase
MNNKIGFPGLGIKDFEIDPVALEFELFGKDITVAWYGVVITLGIVLAITYIYLRLKKIGLVFDDLMDITFGTVIPGILGARLYYVFFYNLEHPGTYTTFEEIIAINKGGLAIYGGIIFGALGAYLTLKAKKVRIPAFFDALGPAVMIGQILGRWGNFFNCEAYGAETTLPWRMRLSFASGFVTEVHPTFLYESLWNLLGLVIICVVFYAMKKRKFDSQVLLFYLSWYGLGRFMIEGLRQDSLYMGPFRVSQLVAILCFVVAGTLFVYFTVKTKENKCSEIIYKEGAKNYKEAMKALFPEKEEEQAEETENGQKESDESDK